MLYYTILFFQVRLFLIDVDLATFKSINIDIWQHNRLRRVATSLKSTISF